MKKPTKAVDVGQLLTTFTDAVVTTYSGDPCKAGLVLSHLTTGFYCSVCRYRDKWGGGKYIVTSSTEKNMAEALVECARKWHDLVSAKQRLGEMVGC